MPREAARQRRLCLCKAFTDLSSEQRPLRRHGLRIACLAPPLVKKSRSRRHKDRFAPSRASARDIRPLVLLLLSEKSHAASLLLACKRARDAPTCYQLFSVSGGRVLCLSLAGGNHGRMTCGRATGNHKIAEKICLFQPLIKIVISEYRNLNCYA